MWLSMNKPAPPPPHYECRNKTRLCTHKKEEEEEENVREEEKKTEAMGIQPICNQRCTTQTTDITFQRRHYPIGHWFRLHH